MSGSRSRSESPQPPLKEPHVTIRVRDHGVGAVDQVSPKRQLQQKRDQTKSPPPDYTLQTMNMQSVLDPKQHERFKRRIPIEENYGKATAVGTTSGVGMKFVRETKDKWHRQQMTLSIARTNNRLPASKPKLTGRNAMTRAQEIEWKLSDPLPALADNKSIRRHAKQTMPSASQAGSITAQQSTRAAAELDGNEQSAPSPDGEIYLEYLRSKQQHLRLTGATTSPRRVANGRRGGKGLRGSRGSRGRGSRGRGTRGPSRRQAAPPPEREPMRVTLKTHFS